MRVHLVLAEVVAALALLAAVVLVSPSQLSKAYALIAIVTSVLPGLMLTGDVKMLNAGVAERASRLRFKSVAAVAVNIPVATAGLMLQEHGHPLWLLIAFVVLGTLGGTAQAFSSVWYYTQTDRLKMLGSKVASAGVKFGFAALAIALSEFTFALVGLTVGAMLEFALNFTTLPWQSGDSRGTPRAAISPLGVAYGLSRVVSAAVRVGLEQLFGSLIASFLVIEQLVGGLNSIFEKYFVRSNRWQGMTRALKLAYLFSMACLAPIIARADFSPADRSSLALLLLIACAGLLPLSEMYVALQRRGQSFVALGSAGICLIAAACLGIAWHFGALRWASLITYILLPGCTFIFYWLSGSNARHNTKH